MAALIYLHPLLFISILHFSLSLSSPLFLPLTKDPSTNQHLAQIFHTPHLSPTTLVLDLNSPFLWLGVNFETQSPTPRRSIQCLAASVDQSGPSDEWCTLSLKNPVTGDYATVVLVHDVVSLTNGVSISAVDEFLHGSAPSILLAGLAIPARGVLGLGRNRVGFVEQISHSFGFSKKFSLCLSSSSSSNGMILFGENHDNDAFKSMIYTPILMGHGDSSYTINLKSLEVHNKKLNLDQSSTLRISTITPYTLMNTKLYQPFIKAFAIEAEAKNMVKVQPFGRFELCYGVKGSKSVPVIDLVLQSEMVKWRIHGDNSMVNVNDEVMCLGIFDGGVDLEASVVLGAHQLEDNLIEIDLGRSMIGFSSLGMKQSSCSLLISSVAHKDIQSL